MQFTVCPLFKKLEKWHHSLFETQIYRKTLCNEVVMLAHCFPYHDMNKISIFSNWQLHKFTVYI